jgi:hypothetical protein
MTDVTFFAYTDGSTDPRIWATNGVSGNYTDSPLNDSVSLEGSGLSTTLTVTGWDSPTWSGTVSGSGTYSGAGTMNDGKAITFKGGAAGSIDNGTDFSGTAAGWAHKN